MVKYLYQFRLCCLLRCKITCSCTIFLKGPTFMILCYTFRTFPKMLRLTEKVTKICFCISKRIRHSFGIKVVKGGSCPQAQYQDTTPSILQFSTSLFWTCPSCRWNCPCFCVLQHWMFLPSVILLIYGRWVSILFGNDATPQPDKLSSCSESSPLKTAGLRVLSLGLFKRSRTWRLRRPLKLKAWISWSSLSPLMDKYTRSLYWAKAPSLICVIGLPSRLRYLSGSPSSFGTLVNQFVDRFKLWMCNTLPCEFVETDTSMLLERSTLTGSLLILVANMFRWNSWKLLWLRSTSARGRPEKQPAERFLRSLWLRSRVSR